MSRRHRRDLILLIKPNEYISKRYRYIANVLLLFCYSPTRAPAGQAMRLFLVMTTLVVGGKVRASLA